MTQAIVERRKKRLAFFQDMLRQYGLVSLANEVEKALEDKHKIEAFYAALTRWIL